MTARVRSISPDDLVIPPRPTLAPTLTPFAAQLHRIAALITENELPPAAITVHDDGGLVAVHIGGHATCEGDVRRWAQALRLLVDVRPADMPDGTAGDAITAVGFRDGVHWTVGALRPVPASVPA